jgi:hypothetical protein
LDKKIELLVYETSYSPFDIPFRRWTELWWNWLHSFPKERSPASDNNGELCGLSQNNRNVWFLAGTLGGSATRTCKIPVGRAILFPIITSAFSYAVDPYLKTEEELTKSTKEDIDTANELSLSLDDNIFGGLKQFRVMTEPFDDVINGKPTKAVSDGYWIFLKPIKPGKLKIHFSGQNRDFFNEVTYYLSIY